jgi:hypothetical protein
MKTIFKLQTKKKTQLLYKKYKLYAISFFIVLNQFFKKGFITFQGGTRRKEKKISVQVEKTFLHIRLKYMNCLFKFFGKQSFTNIKSKIL